MPQPNNLTWFYIIVSIVSASSFFVSLASFWISKRQKEISEAKLKLDLYNRRFEIYKSAIRFYRACNGAIPSEHFEKIREDFMLAQNESRFLFNSDDGIFDILNKWQLESGCIFPDKEFDKPSATEAKSLLHTKANTVCEKIINTEQLLLLTEKMKKYLSFNNLNI